MNPIFFLDANPFFFENILIFMAERDWICARCHFSNHGLLPFCEVCEARGPSRPRKGEADTMDAATSWKCDDKCTFLNDLDLVICEACDTPQSASGWVCARCTLFNKKLNESCDACNLSRGRSPSLSIDRISNVCKMPESRPVTILKRNNANPSKNAETDSATIPPVVPIGSSGEEDLRRFDRRDEFYHDEDRRPGGEMDMHYNRDWMFMVKDSRLKLLKEGYPDKGKVSIRPKTWLNPTGKDRVSLISEVRPSLPVGHLADVKRKGAKKGKTVAEDAPRFPFDDRGKGKRREHPAVSSSYVELCAAAAENIRQSRMPSYEEEEVHEFPYPQKYYDVFVPGQYREITPMKYPQPNYKYSYQPPPPPPPPPPQVYRPMFPLTVNTHGKGATNTAYYPPEATPEPPKVVRPAKASVCPPEREDQTIDLVSMEAVDWLLEEELEADSPVACKSKMPEEEEDSIWKETSDRAGSDSFSYLIAKGIAYNDFPGYLLPVDGAIKGETCGLVANGSQRIWT